MALSSWSTTAASNATVGSINWAEGQAPSTVNNSARQEMADVRAWYEDAEWRDFGHTPTYISATSFSVTGDKSAIYVVGRRLRCADSSTLYATVSAVAYASVTTVTVVMDSGSLSASLTGVALGLDHTNQSIPSFLDSYPIVVGSSDATKKLKLEIDGFTTATTRTITIPDATDTMVNLASTQTLTNKTLTSPTITSPTITNASLTSTGATLTSPVINTGISSSSTGIQMKRVTTGSIGSGGYTNVTVTWPTSLADTNYTVVASVVDSTSAAVGLSVNHIVSKSASNCVVCVFNGSVGSLTGDINAIAIHD